MPGNILVYHKSEAEGEIFAGGGGLAWWRIIHLAVFDDGFDLVSYLAGFYEFGVRFVVAALGGQGVARESGDAPAGWGHEFDEKRFVSGGGLKVVAAVDEEDVKLFLLFVSEDGEAPESPWLVQVELFWLAAIGAAVAICFDSAMKDDVSRTATRMYTKRCEYSSY